MPGARRSVLLLLLLVLGQLWCSPLAAAAGAPRGSPESRALRVRGGPRRGSGGSDGSGSVAGAAAAAAASGGHWASARARGPTRACPSCDYFVPREEAAAALKSGRSYIRIADVGHRQTGNVVTALRRAMLVAWTCKAVLELPDLPRSQQPFDAPVPPAQRFLDFARRPGEAAVVPRFCNATHRLVQERWQAFFPKMRDHMRGVQVPHPRAEHEMQASCLRWFLGFCNPGFCNGSAGGSDTLVVHVRQGDITPPNYGATRFAMYGQPPLAFYLDAARAAGARRIVLVGDAPEASLGPLWRAFETLAHLGPGLAPSITLQTGNWSDDVRTIVCAANFAESKSSTVVFTRLGFHEKRFVFGVCHPPTLGEEVYAAPHPRSYSPARRWHNTPEQWVEALLSPTKPLQRCPPDDWPSYTGRFWFDNFSR